METPKILFENEDEWTSKIEDMYEKIKKSIWKSIVDYDGTKFRYHLLDFSGFGGLYETEKVMYNELNELTQHKHKQWCREIIGYIIYGINGFIIALDRSNKIDLFTREELGRVLYENIIWQLDDESHSPNLLEGMPQYICKKCNYPVGYRDEDGECFRCGDDEYSILMRASQEGDLDRVNKLIEAGENINFRSNNGNTPLLVASFSGHYDIADRLIRTGANINDKTSNRSTPLICASWIKHHRKENESIEESWGEFPKIANRLIEAGADINCCDDNGYTALSLSMERGIIDIADSLIKAGANTEVEDHCWKIAISTASDLKRFDVMNRFIEVRNKINPKDKNDSNKNLDVK